MTPDAYWLTAVAWHLLAIGPLTAQTPVHAFRGSQLHGAAFVEQVYSDVITASGAAQRRRIIVRTARYSMIVREDTLVVTADSLALSETADGVQRTINVDAVTGGRWRLAVDTTGRLAAVEQPFVPRDIADVSDVGSAMDDFLPAAPPVAYLGKPVDAGHLKWSRLSDSAGYQRYRWSGRQNVTASSVGDSVVVKSNGTTNEDGNMAWDNGRGPIAWMRHIQTDLTSQFAGRTVRAVVDQRIEVRRVH